MARKAMSGPNAGSRKAAARKAHKCQLCGTKVMPAKAKSVIVDPPGDGEVKVVKAREGRSYWCSDCAGKKASSYERAIERKAEGGSTKTKGRGKAKKSTAKGKAKPAAKKRSTKAKKGTRKRATKTKAADPF